MVTVLQAGVLCCELCGDCISYAPTGSPARQAEETARIPPWPITHPGHWQHLLSRHGAARLSQETK